MSSGSSQQKSMIPTPMCHDNDLEPAATKTVSKASEFQLNSDGSIEFIHKRPTPPNNVHG